VRRYFVSDLLPLLGGEYEVVGEPDGKYFTNLRPVLEADVDSLVFISADRLDKQELAARTRASIIVCDHSVVPDGGAGHAKCLIRVSNPKLVFARIGNALFDTRPDNGIHPTAWVHPEAQVHPETHIGAFTYVGKCTIGEGSVIYGHVYLYDRVVIRRRVTIHAGCIIGADGFGYLRNERDECEAFPHVGGVLIEDDVDIGANTCIDRGALGDTVVKQGAKIDNLVHVAHNVVIGRHAEVIADSMIGGSTIIGDYGWLSPSCVLRDQLSIGERAFIGMGAVVTRDVPAGETWTGSPARPLNEFLAAQRKIRELSR
jgi:UDP-3-O-[3-hydroxymyristoyl] glucosamine N-acyltransferase